MSIKIRNLTTNNRFEHIDVRINGTSSPSSNFKLKQSTSDFEIYDDLGSKTLLISVTTVQPLDGEIILSSDIYYQTGCIDYILSSFENMILKITDNLGTKEVYRLYKIELTKQDTCPGSVNTHIDVNIKHPDT